MAGRTAGQAVLGLRTVNEVTHERPGWRAAMIRWAVRQPPQILLIAVSGSSSVRRALEQLRELQPAVDELRSRNGRDQRELNQSLIDLYKARGNAPLKGCWPLLAAILVGVAYDGIITAGVLRPPKRQGLHDRLAHVLVLDGKAGGSNHHCPEPPLSWPVDAPTPGCPWPTSPAGHTCTVDTRQHRARAPLAY